MKQIICEHGKCTLIAGKSSTQINRSNQGFRTEFTNYNIVESQQKNMMKRRKEFLY